MRKFSGLLAILALSALGMVGCNDDTNPTAVVQSAAYNLKYQNLWDFKRLLSGEARIRYGTYEGMRQLRNNLLGVKNLRSSNVRLVKTLSDGAVIRRNYTVDIMGGELRLMVAFVNCATEPKAFVIPAHKNHRKPGEIIPAHTMWVDITSCRIDRLN